MGKRTSKLFIAAVLSALAIVFSAGSVMAYLSPSNPAVLTADPEQIKYMDPSYQGDYTATPDPSYVIGPNSIPDYLTSPNWAYTPPLRKFIDTLPPLGCDQTNNLGQCIPVAVPDIVTYPGSDYYEIELIEFPVQMHSDLPATKARGYRQINAGTNLSGGCTDPVEGSPNSCTDADNTDLTAVNAGAQFLGPIIVATKNRPVRVKFINSLPTGAEGDSRVPVDTSIMGAGPFEIDYDPVTKEPMAFTTGDFTQNRALLHLHGGRTPWISDGTPHQWITPAGETTAYPTGVSVSNVPDMPDPGPGAQTYYWTNQQSSRMMFYHDHSWGITRVNVYVGEAAGYLVRDNTEKALIDNGIIPGLQSDGTTMSYGGEIPLVIQDKSWVDGDPTSPTYVLKTDPTWKWGTGTLGGNGVRPPVTGDFWWPHVYMPAQNPFDFSGIAPMGRWAYGPYFWPATNNFFQPIPNPYFDPTCDATDPTQTDANQNGLLAGFCQPPEIPSSPNPSWGAEAFMDTPTVNGTAYPVMEIEPKPYRFRILNASHDRFFNLHMYIADPSPPTPVNTPEFPPNPADFTASGYGTFSGTLASNTEVRMIPASPNAVSTAPPGGVVLAKPATWPEDGRPGGTPDWSWAGPEWIMIGTEGGFLPQPVVIPANPLSWNADVTTFNAGNVNGGSLIVGPAERVDVIVDFSAYAGQTLILYNDAPAPWPALDPHYDYYTDAPDNRDMGGHDTTPIGFGPNTRTIMQIKVGSGASQSFNMAALNEAFDPTNGDPGVFQDAQDPIVAGQGNMNPTGDPALYEAFLFDGTNYSAYNRTYNANFPARWPNWGIAQINDTEISFYNPEAGAVVTKPLEKKAIQDEQGETFDEFGRMRAGLGLTVANPAAGQVNFVIQTFSDPSTEILEENGIQVWKITHNGVDTHPIHFHLFDVQVLNRVGWDGFLRLPDPTELGWKDTVRISPLEDTIVALRPITPELPFGIPESIRPLNPATAIDDPTHLSAIDPITGEAWLTPNLNRILNFDWEYVWHCHILSHEENDMMRPISFKFQENLPDAPTDLATASSAAVQVDLTWTDPTPVNFVTRENFGNAKNEIGFRIERSDDGGGNFTIVGTALANATSFSDTSASPGSSYVYRVIAYNAAGDSLPSNGATQGTPALLPATGATLTPSVASPKPADTTVTFTATGIGGSGGYEYKFWHKGPATGDVWQVVQNFSTSNTWTWATTTADIGTNNVSVYVRAFGSTAPYEAVKGLTYSVTATPATGATLTPDLASPQVAPASITFTAQGSGSSSSQYEYQFWLKGPSTGNAWQVVRAYSTTATWTWNADVTAIGTSNISVYVRASGSTASVEALKSITYSISSGATPATAVTLVSDLASPQVAPASITFTAQGSGSSGSQYEYQFWLKGPSTGNIWQVARGYSTTATWTWSAGTNTIGTNTISVYTRALGSTSSVEAFKVINNYIISP